LQLALLAAAGALVLGLAGYTALSLQPRGNPSGQASSDPNQRCAPSPCGAPDGFEVDVTNVRPMDDHLAITVVFRNHTKSQLFEAVSYRHTSPADFLVRSSGRDVRPMFNAECPSWPELDVARGATSPSRTLCFGTRSSSGAVLVWNPDLGFISQPVSIALG